MKTLNRYIAFSKRIISNKLYCLLLVLIILLSVFYRLLPAQSKSTDIKVALYTDSHSEYFDNAFESLENINSMYSFYLADSEASLKKDVRTGKAYCGFYIPELFFKDFIESTVSENKITRYFTPSAILLGPITETLFSNIFKVCAGDILLDIYNNSESNSMLTQNFDKYLHSDEVFHIKDNSSGNFVTNETENKLDLPLIELMYVLSIFSALIGLLNYVKASEAGYFISLSKRENISIASINVAAAVIPVFCCAVIASLISGYTAKTILMLALVSVVSYVFTMFIGVITKKSNQLATVIPIVTLLTAMISFVSYVI